MSLLLLRVCIALAGFVVFNWRLRVALRREPPPEGSAPRTSDVSVVIPARNEQQSLPLLLASLSESQLPPREVIVVDDHSTDATGAIAAAAGARVLVPAPLPAGWVGKPWACASGAAAARAPLLLFTDADTVHAPDLLARAVHALERRKADLLSVLPTHLCVAPWERLQGVFQLLLLVACRAGVSPGPHGERCFCIGQFLLIRRTAYERIGGHEAVRHRVAEDLAMARRIESCGLRFTLVHLPGALRVRMYPGGLGDFIRGWRRNFREGIPAVGVLGVLESVLVFGWLLDVQRWLLEAGLRGDGVGFALAGGAYLLTSLNIAYWQRELGAFRVRHALAYPLFAALFVCISLLALFDQVLRRPIAWKGRVLPVDSAPKRSGET
ncbi:MAG TPA: glycosyltransferase family 2 protein [Polyangiaceae bacterium]|nr:glycosyltransferase family 2 protein [Polyangiaceae bacterium]